MRSLILACLISTSALGQGIVKTIYQDFLKYGTVYTAGDINNSYEPARKEYMVRTPDGGSLYDIPIVEDVTDYFPFDYRFGFGIRKLGRFDYERKPNNFWTGNQEIEKQIALDAPTSAVKGLEYLFHYEFERLREETWVNNRFFIRHTGKYHIVKAETRAQGIFDFNYQSGEVRARLPLGKKMSISAGAIYRTHQRAYGYNPFEIWVNETDEDGNPINPWYELGYLYGYYDVPFSAEYIHPITGEALAVNDWYWFSQNGDIVAYSDEDFRETIFRDLINEFNNDRWDELDAFGLISPIVGADYYHYKPKFWFHGYANCLLPMHRYIQGDVDYSYLHRNHWMTDGLHDIGEDQWVDYQFGTNLGWKISRSFAIFLEGEYTKYWDTQFFMGTAGFNYTFR